MAVQIQGGSNAAGKVNVTSDYELAVAPTKSYASSGIVSVSAESSPATDTGGRMVRPLEATDDHRLRVVSENASYWRVFQNGGVSHDIMRGASGMSQTFGGIVGGGLRFNTTPTGTNAAFCQIATWRSFRIPPEGCLYAAFNLQIPIHKTNQTWAAGFHTHTNMSMSTFPTLNSGVWVRRTGGGTVELVLRRNAVDIATATVDMSNVTDGQWHHIVLGVSHYHAEVWFNGELKAKLDFHTGLNPLPYQYAAAGMKLNVIQYNDGVVVSPETLALMSWGVWDAASSSNVTAAEQSALRGAVPPNAQSAQGQATQWGNSAAPTALTLSNTAATLTNTINGALCSFAAVASATTDYVILAWLNDGSSSQDTHGTFMLTGVQISAVNTGAANSGTVPTTLLFAVAVGSSGVSLATVDNDTGKSPRRYGVGTVEIPINALIGQSANRSIDYRFANPLPVNDNEHCHLIMRVLSGAATASQVVVLNVQLLGYFVP